MKNDEEVIPWMYSDDNIYAEPMNVELDDDAHEKLLNSLWLHFHDHVYIRLEEDDGYCYLE